MTGLAVIALALAIFCVVVGLNLGGAADRLGGRSAGKGDVTPAIASPAIRLVFVASGAIVAAAAIALLAS
jgi:hypothetical protein